MINKKIYPLFLCLILLSGCSFKQDISNNKSIISQSDDDLMIQDFINDQIVESPEQETQAETPTAISPPAENQPLKTDNKETSDFPVQDNLPKFFQHQLDFVSQAPHGVWDDLHQEACEEASMIMAVAHIKKQPVTVRSMSQGIISLVKWQEENGYQVDLSAQEVFDILRDYFGLVSSVETNVSIDRIKKELVDGAVIIIPAAGRELKNPYFQRPGPIYHMLVIIGYDDDKRQFITNDPGTRHGAGFRYDYNILINAIHDWDHSLAKGGMTEEKMKQGSKVMVVVK